MKLCAPLFVLLLLLNVVCVRTYAVDQSVNGATTRATTQPTTQAAGDTEETPTDILYLCDFSGSMMGQRSGLLIRELRDVVGRLTANQRFNVVFVKEGNGKTFEALDDSKLLPANTFNKSKLYKFLDGMRPAGQTQPLEGIELAFKMNPRPQTIYILSDGFEASESRYAVGDLIDRLNKDKKTRINTVMFRNNETDWNLPEIKSLEAIMKLIAKDNGGTYKRVSADKL